MKISRGDHFVEIGVPVEAVHGVGDRVVVLLLHHAPLVDFVLHRVLHDISWRFHGNNIAQVVGVSLLEIVPGTLAGRSRTERTVQSHAQPARFLHSLPFMRSHQVGPALSVVQARDQGVDVGVFVLEVNQFFFVEPLFMQRHLPVVVLGDHLHVLLVVEGLVVEFFPPLLFFLLRFVLFLQLQLLHVGYLLFLVQLLLSLGLLDLLVAHLVLEGVQAVLLQMLYFLVFLGLSLGKQFLVLVAPVLFPVNSLLHFRLSR